MSARRISLLLLLIPTLFAAKCRKGDVGEVTETTVTPQPPSVRLQITAIDPDQGEPGVGFRATVYGTGFQDGVEAWVGEQEISTTRWRDANSVSISVPGLSAGSYDVRIRNPDGDVATLRSGIVISQSTPRVPENCRNVTIPFDLDASALNSDARQALRTSGECFSLQGVRVRVEGHCDERGTTEYNLALGQRRADAVQRYLVSQGIAASRISTVSYGEEQPLSRGSGERVWSQNRRAEIKISE